MGTFNKNIPASEVTLADNAGDFDASQVEAAIAEMQVDIEALQAGETVANHEAEADPHPGYVKENDASWTDLTDAGETTLHSHAGGGVTDATYLVTAAHAGLSAEVVVPAAVLTVLDDVTVAAMVDTLGGAASTGTGGLVRATSPTLVTPALGTPSALVLTNASGYPVASDTVSGIVELATTAETTTGTDATRAVTPDGLAGSVHGEVVVQMVVFDFTTDCATGDGKFYFHVDNKLGGMDLVRGHAEVITAGTTGTMDIQIANVDAGVDMLSTKLTIDSGETGSDTAATAAVINTANDDVQTNEVLRVDVDAVQTTKAKGLIVTLVFRLP